MEKLKIKSSSLRGLPSPPASFTESFLSLDNLFNGENNEPQALYSQFIPVPLTALQPRLETYHNRPNISLIDRTNNTVELMPKVNEKPPPEPENITFSEKLSKLFP